ncbi:LON peptidase substrate-binding domain-containing protein [Paraferrimonas sedimenticola]|uniref:Peptidase S16 n=1 Tax=Paraferrimonas sedimenticola TaxID=375674 RepID=A0AA37RY51_9GAMM|nr:LON peptidase substrate-binding domain-containing protein [Paraferrimonas sedimenticola]GLP97201.1 peptidase S16 [Paraferrimonas sedimenticola]
MSIGLFPLPMLLMPGGVSQLRIFEPRYQRLVAEAHQNDNSFVLSPSMLTGESHPFRLGVRVAITDFDRLQDGLLGISIEAIERVSLYDFRQADDKLHTAQYVSIANLPAGEPLAEYHWLAEGLAPVLSQHPLYEDQITSAQLADLTWVCQRWLEFLPFSETTKRQLLAVQESRRLAQILTQVLPKAEPNS